MSKTRKPRRLADTYTFPGFGPLAYVQGIFGDPQARFITLVRQAKTQITARVARSVGPRTIAEEGPSRDLPFGNSIARQVPQTRDSDVHAAHALIKSGAKVAPTIHEDPLYLTSSFRVPLQ